MVRVESNPQLVQIVPPNEVVVLISFELALGDIRGMMNLCIPYNSIERISGKLSANSWVTYGRRQATPETHRDDQPATPRGACRTGGNAGRHPHQHRRPDRTARGRHHHHGKRRPQPLVVAVQGVPKFPARPGAFKGHKAIEVEAQV